MWKNYFWIRQFGKMWFERIFHGKRDNLLNNWWSSSTIFALCLLSLRSNSFGWHSWSWQWMETWSFLEVWVLAPHVAPDAWWIWVCSFQLFPLVSLPCCWLVGWLVDQVLMHGVLLWCGWNEHGLWGLWLCGSHVDEWWCGLGLQLLIEMKCWQWPWDGTKLIHSQGRSLSCWWSRCCCWCWVSELHWCNGCQSNIHHCKTCRQWTGHPIAVDFTSIGKS